MPDNDQQLQPGQLTDVPQSNFNLEASLGKLVDLTADVPIAPNRNLLLGDNTGNGEKVNPLWGLYLNIMKSSPNALESTSRTNYDQTERYSTDKWGGYNPNDINQEDAYGKQQGWFSQMANRIGKLGVTTLGSFASTLMDIPNTVSAVKNQKLDNMWDNSTNNWSTDLQNWAEKVMPNYQTNWETQHPFLNLIPLYGNAGNGWGNVLQQTGFTIGTIGGSILQDMIVGTVTGGVGEIPLAAMQINKAVYKLGKLIGMGEEGFEALKNSIKSSDQVIKGLEGIDKFNFAVRKGIWGANMVTSGMGEAAFEGIDSYRTLTQDLNKEFYEKNGRLPDYKESKEIDGTARDAANTRFVLNTALLAATNSIQFGSLLKPFQVTKDLLEAEEKSGIKIALKQGSKDEFELLHPEGKLNKSLNFLKNSRLSQFTWESSSEGFEEGAQYAIQTGVNDYYKRKYDGQGADVVNNLMKSFGTGMSEALGTQEGWENTVYGLLGGMLYKGGEHVYYNAKGIHEENHQDRINNVIKGLNTQSLTGIFENKYGEAVHAVTALQDLNKAAKDGDLFAFKNYKHEQFVNFVLSGLRQNKFDTRIDQLNSLKTMDDKEFRQTFGIPMTEESKRDVSGMVDKMVENANWIKDVHKRVSRTFINPFEYKGTGNYKDEKTKEKQNEENEHHIAYEELKDHLVNSMAVNKDSMDRIQKLKDQISGLDSSIDVNTVTNLTSGREGINSLKEDFTQKAKDLKDSLKLKDDAKQAKLLKWYNDRIENMNTILNDPKKAGDAYNTLLNETFDRAKRASNASANDKTASPIFPRSVMTDMLDTGEDIYKLNLRNKIAVHQYARLSTPGGFKREFNNALAVRKEANETPIDIKPAIQSADLKQDELMDILSKNPDELPQAKSQQASTPQRQQQVDVADSQPAKATKKAMPNQQAIELNKLIVKFLDGKRIAASGAELHFLGFRVKDDAKFEHPDKDIDKDFVKVKSIDGMDYYMPKEMADNARVIASSNDGSDVVELNKDGSTNTPENLVDNTNPSAENPPTGGETGRGNVAMHTEDFLAKIFVPEDLKPAFNNLILNTDKETIRQNLKVAVRPLPADRKAAYDQQKANASYTPYKGFPGVFVAKAPIELSLYHGEQQIGFISYPERLLFQVGNQFVTIDKLTAQEYTKFTGREPAQYDADVADFRRQKAFKNYLALRFRENGNQAVTLTPQELRELADVQINYGQLDMVKKDSERPLYRDLAKNTFTITDANGNKHQAMGIVSIPKMFKQDSYGNITRGRSEDYMNVIYSQNVRALGVRNTVVDTLIAQHPEAFTKLGSRYVGVVEMPDGSFTTVALRPSTMDGHSKAQMFEDLKRQSADTARNAVHAVNTREEADYVILEGNQEQYYKLNSEQAKSYNDEFNTNLNNKLFVSDANASVWYTMWVSPIGAVRLDAFEPVSRTYNTFYVSAAKVASANNFSDFVKHLQDEIAKRGQRDPQIAALRLSINENSFKQNLGDETDREKNITAEEAAEKLSSAVSRNLVVPNMKLVPNGTAVTNAYNRLSTATRESAAPETRETVQPQEGVQPQTDIVAETIEPTHHSPQTGIFESLSPVDEQGHEVPIDVTPTSVQNQEDLSGIRFPNIEAALRAIDIRFETNPQGVTEFYQVSNNQRIDTLTGFAPRDVAESFRLDWEGKHGIQTSDEDAFKLVGQGEGMEDLNRMINIEQAKQYISAILPSTIQVKDINTIMDRISLDGKVYGAFSNGVIYLNSEAPAGTEYHEAFHATFRTMLTDGEIKDYLKAGQESLYKDLKKDGKSINNLLHERKAMGLYQNLSAKDAYDRLYEEHMADKFQDWKNKKANAGFFDKLFSLIKNIYNWITRNKTDLDALFNNIDKGIYKYRNIAANQFTQGTTDNTEMPEIAFALIPARPGIARLGSKEIPVARKLDADRSKQVVQSVASYFEMYKRFNENVNKSDEEILDTILNDLKNRYDINNPEYAGWTEAQKQSLQSSDLSYIYDNKESRDTIKEAAKSYISTMKYIEQFQEEQFDEDEQYDEDQPADKKDGSVNYDNTAENRGGFTSLPKILREFIAFTSYNTTDEFGNKNIKEGVPVIGTVDSLSVYYGLLRTLANTTNPVQFFQKMVKYTGSDSSNDQARAFVQKFIDESGLQVTPLMDDGQLICTKNSALAEIVRKGFNKYRIDYVFTEHDMSTGGSESYASNRRNVEMIQFDSWSKNFLNTYGDYSEQGQRDARRALLDVRNRWFDDRNASKYDDATLSQAIFETQKALKDIGITVSRDYIKYSLLNVNAKKFEALSSTFASQGNVLHYDDPQNTFISKQDHQYTQIMKIPDEHALTFDFVDNLSRILAGNNNPFIKTITTGQRQNEQGETETVEEEIDTAMIGRLQNLGKGNAMFDETVGESSFTNAANKVVFAHQDGTYNIKASYSLRDANLRRQLRETGVREQLTAYRDVYDADWLTKNFLLTSAPFENIADDLRIVRIDGMRATESNTIGQAVVTDFRDQKEGVTYGDYSPREFIVNLMNMYVSYSQQQRGKDGKMYSTAPHLIRVLEASKTGDAVLLPINTGVYTNGTATPKAVDIVFGELMKEYNRIKRVTTEVNNPNIAKVYNYHDGQQRGLHFTDNMAPHIKGMMSELEGKATRNEDLSPEDIARVKSSIGESLNDMVKATMDVMTREGIINKLPNGDYNNVLLFNGRTRSSASATGYFAGHELSGLKAVKKSSDFVDNVGHVIVNDYINTLSYNQILHGDSALGLKNDGGIDAVKRAKGDNAAIVPMYTELTAPALGIVEPFTHSNIAIVKEPKADSAALGEKGKGIKLADAQMYATVKALRYTLWGLGRLSPRLAKVLDALEAGEDIHNMRDEQGRTYDGVFDSENGLEVNHEMTNSLKLVYKDGHSYFKMSVVVLQPNLTSYKKDGEWVALPGWETLHNLRTKMETENIHFAAPESASKMMTLDLGQDIKEFSDLKGHLYNNQYFGLQTENPSNKREITTPTQLLQLIDNEQTDDAPVWHNGQEISVKQLKDAYQNYVSQKVSNAYNIAKHEIYTIQDFNKDVEQSIRDGQVTPKLADFQQRAVETLERSGSDAQLLDFFSLDENGNPKFNLNLSATKTKFAQLYLSYFSRGIMSQKSPGYTVALMSGMDTKHVKVATRVENGRVVEHSVVRRDQWENNYGGYQNQPILPSREAVTHSGQLFTEELQYNVPEYDKEGNITGYYSEMMLPAHFKDFLNNISLSDEEIPEAISKGLGVRIPSQDKHSFMALKIVDFLPANLGSTGMFPKELVALSGADFDIDKEFISRYSFYTTTNPRTNRKEFKKYGDATTPEGKWEEYKDWMHKNNKSVKNIVGKLLDTDADYRRLADDKSNDAVATEIFSDRQAHLKKYMDSAITNALRQLGQPSSLQEYMDAVEAGKEPNNGVLANRILDAYVGLLTNKAIQDIAKTPATLDALADIQKNPELYLRDRDNVPVGESVFSKGTQYPVDSLVGKYNAFKNNTTGKSNIGIDVNANLIYSILNKADISLKEGVEGFNFDSQQYRSFSGTREFNLESGQYDGRRTNDIHSTLITSATDEAKEQLNALYGLGVDALKAVDYLVSLKTPLKTAIYLVNQPAVRNYLEIKAVKQNTLQTAEEEQTFKANFRDKALQRTDAQIKDYVNMSNQELLGMFEREGMFRKEC